MSSSRATVPLLGRLAAAAGAAMRGSNNINSVGALRAIVVVESSSSAMLFAGLQQRRPHATSSWIKLFKPAQAFFGGGSSSGSGSAASTSAVSAAAAAAAVSVSTPAAAAAAPPQFGFAASAPASASAVAAAAARVPPKPVSPPPKKAAAGAAAASPIKKKRSVPRGPTAYALFLKEQLSAAPAGKGDARSFAQRSAAVAAAWKELPASSRARFEAASQAAKASLPPRESKPAKALSGYQLFVREKLPTLRDESVAGGAGAVSAMRAAAAAWSAAPAQVKAEFAARAKAMGTKR